MIRILLVDDEHAIKQGLRTLIAEAEGKFAVVGEANNGLEALALIESCSPDLLFIDIKMPEMDGLELLEAMSGIEGKRETIVISGYDDFRYAQQALRYGVKDYLLKPIEPDKVLEVLQSARDRISATDKEMERASYWAAYCREQAPAIAENLWMLKEDVVQENLDRIDRLLRLDGEHHRLAKQVYLNLSAFLNLELSNREVAELEELPGKLLAVSGEEALTVVKDTLAEAAGHIRRRRHIGMRNSIGLALQYIDEHYRKETLSLKEVSKQVGISDSYLSLLFKEEMGIGFIQYVTRKRMELAKLMLQETKQKALEVSYEVGYSDYSHFNKAFKKYCGVSPLEYKKRFGTY